MATTMPDVSKGQGASPKSHPPRTLPALTELNTPFWTGGADGELRIQRCDSCGRWQFPPRWACRACGADELHHEAVSGRGAVYSYGVSRHEWRSGMSQPYVIALVELAEQAGLRMTTNIVGCEPGRVFIGMQVRVTFEEQDGVYLPLFEPDLDQNRGAPTRDKR